MPFKDKTKPKQKHRTHSFGVSPRDAASIPNPLVDCSYETQDPEKEIGQRSGPEPHPYGDATPSQFTDTSNAIDWMEKEQEGIVLKLMQEINSLKEENKMLKTLLRASTITPTTSASSSPRSSFSFQTHSPTEIQFSSPFSPNLYPTSSSLSKQNALLGSQRRATITTTTNLKRVPNPLSNPLALNGSGSVPRSRSRSRSNSLSVKSPSLFSLDSLSFEPDASAVSNKTKRKGSFNSMYCTPRSIPFDDAPADMKAQPQKLQIPKVSPIGTSNSSNHMNRHRRSISENLVFDSDLKFSTPKNGVFADSSEISTGLLISQRR